MICLCGLQCAVFLLVKLVTALEINYYLCNTFANEISKVSINQQVKYKHILYCIAHHCAQWMAEYETSKSATQSVDTCSLTNAFVSMSGTAE